MLYRYISIDIWYSSYCSLWTFLFASLFCYLISIDTYSLQAFVCYALIIYTGFIIIFFFCVFYKMFCTFAMLSILQIRILFFIFVVNEIFPHFSKRIYWFHFLSLIPTCNSDRKKSMFYSRRKNDFFFCSKKIT